MAKKDLRDIMNAREENFVQTCLLVKEYLESVLASLSKISIDIWYEEKLNEPPRYVVEQGDESPLSKLYNERASVKLPPKAPTAIPYLDDSETSLTETQARFVIKQEGSNTYYPINIYGDKASFYKFGDKTKRDLKVESGFLSTKFDWVETVELDRLKSTEINYASDTPENNAAFIILQLEKFADDELALFLRAHRKGFGVSEYHAHRSP